MEKLIELGFLFIPDFITVDEEKMILDSIKKSEAKKKSDRNSIQRFGSTVPYQSHVVSKTIPEYFNFVLDRIVERNIHDSRPESVSVNEYHVGQAIRPHIDSRGSGEKISVISLLGDAIMVFEKGDEVIKVDLPPRCLSQMSGVVRHEWMHSIEPVKASRYSIVFRK
jgi:alkylated DNA repair dioxygenase AlkB